MPRCRPTIGRRSTGAPLTREALQAELDRHWESTGFVTRAHEDARRTSARAALDRFWDEQQADPSPVIGVEQEFAFRFGPDRVRGRMDRVDRRPDGSMAVVDYKSGDVRDRPPPAADRANRSSSPSTPWAGRRSTAVRRTTSSLHFLESGEGAQPGDAGSPRQGADQIAATAAGIRAGNFAGQPDRCAARLARSARSALTRPGDPPRPHPRRRLSSGGIAALVGVVVASQLCPAPTAGDPCPDADRNRLVVVGLGAIGASRS